jgi:hypothetical protein
VAAYGSLDRALDSPFFCGSAVKNALKDLKKSKRSGPIFVLLFACTYGKIVSLIGNVLGIRWAGRVYVSPEKREIV